MTDKETTKLLRLAREAWETEEAVEYDTMAIDAYMIGFARGAAWAAKKSTKNGGE